MVLITALVCAVNLYFVVTSIILLKNVTFYVLTGLALFAYVVFVFYLV